MTSDRTVPVRVVYEWTCEDCGRDNICRPISAEEDMPADEAAEAKAALGIEPWEEGQLVCVPDTVTCAYCGSEFRTPNDKEEPADDA